MSKISWRVQSEGAHSFRLVQIVPHSAELAHSPPGRLAVAHSRPRERLLAAAVALAFCSRGWPAHWSRRRHTTSSNWISSIPACAQYAASRRPESHHLRSFYYLQRRSSAGSEGERGLASH